MKNSNPESAPDAAIFNRLGPLEINPGSSTGDWESLKAALSERIGYLLENQAERLVQILYRLDVRESKVHRIFQEQPQSAWAEALAGLIIEREKERIRWRNFYASGNPAD